MYFNEQTILFYHDRYAWATSAHTNLYMQTLHYGYGVFEGIRSYETGAGTRIFKGREHFERLQNSCRLLGIPFEVSVEEMMAHSFEVLRRNGFSDAYIRPLVICEPNMTLINGSPSRLLICAWKWGAYLGEKLLRLKISPFCRPHPRSTFIEAKACGHYVNSILATSDARKSGFDEALLLDVDGFLAEGPGANLFFEKDGQFFTPKLGHILPGITRQTVFEICEMLEIPVVEGKFSAADLFAADSAFFCGTGAEIVGIGSVDDCVFSKKWSETMGAKVQEAYSKLVREEIFEMA